MERGKELARSGIGNNAARKLSTWDVLKSALTKLWGNGGEINVSTYVRHLCTTLRKIFWNIIKLFHVIICKMFSKIMYFETSASNPHNKPQNDLMKLNGKHHVIYCETLSSNFSLADFCTWILWISAIIVRLAPSRQRASLCDSRSD